MTSWEETMIVTRIFGGLGNQMFQYAFGLYLSNRSRTELVLDCSALAVDPLRDYMLDRWTIDARLASEDQRQLFPRRYGGWGLKNLWWARMPLRRVRERPFGFREKYLACGNNVYLDGYWQSEQFFPNLRERLQTLFQPSRPINEESTAIARQMEKVSAASLHVRRGDFVQSKVIFETHGTCPLGYYQTCVADLLERNQKLQIFIFSDDHEWCRQNLHFACPTIHVDHNGDGKMHEDLWLMTQCRHHILANSSFSWWGAWLRADESGTVYAPERWFRNDRYDSQSIIPATWRKMAEADFSKQRAA